jgi:hypothetical protein
MSETQDLAVLRMIEIATAYAECCADCEMRRTSAEPAPRPKWQAAWDRRMRLQSELLRSAKALTNRETEPPELRGRP